MADLDDEGDWLEPDDVDAVLAAYGLRIPKSRTVHSVEDAIAFGEEVDSSIVLKVISPSAVHKSDVGGVALDVRGADAISAAIAAADTATEAMRETKAYQRQAVIDHCVKRFRERA